MIKTTSITTLLFTLLLAFGAMQRAEAQVFTPRLPIYIVNGERMDEEQVRAIDPDDIV